MKENTVYVLLRESGHASPCIDGVFVTEKDAKEEIINLLGQFGVDEKDYKYGNTEYYWEIHSENLK